MRFLHTADLHLSRVQDLECLKVLLATARQESCSHVLICGDMFDQDQSYLQLEAEVLTILETFPGQILILPGNHDAVFLNRRARLSRNSLVFSPEQALHRLDLEEIEILALPFRLDSDMSLFRETDSDPEKTLLMVHGTYYSKDFFYREEHKVYFPLFEQDLRDRFAYVALGHYHRSLDLQLGRTRLINPGSPRITRASDLGPRQAAVLDSRDWQVSWVRLPLPFIHPLELVITPADDLHSITSRLLGLLSSPYNAASPARIRVQVRGILSPELQLTDLRDRLIDSLQSQGLDYLDPDLQQTGQIQPELMNNSYVTSLLEEAERLCREQDLDPQTMRSFALGRLQSLFQP